MCNQSRSGQNQNSACFEEDNDIIVVSGLPRSGTSMMMAMLQASGVELLIDNIRSADQDNPRGYFEYEKVKRMHKDNSWVHEAQGKAVKIVSSFLEFLPQQYKYRIIFMQRSLQEILASQKKMLQRNQQKSASSDETLFRLFTQHLENVIALLERQSNIQFCIVSYNNLLLPHPEKEINPLMELFDGRLSIEPMLAVVDQALYRQRQH